MVIRGMICGAILCLAAQAAWGQQAPAKPPAARGPQSDAERKAAIADSECWRRAVFERDQWLRSQTVFSPDQVAQIKSDFAARVDAMSANEMQQVLQDLETKFKLLNTPEAREARAWFGQYMAVLSDRKREEVLKEIPDIATMTPAQLSQVIMKIQRKVQSQASFNRSRQSRVNAQLQANRDAKQARAQSRPAAQTYRAPYRSQQSNELPFERHNIGPSRVMTLDPNGGLWMNLSF